MPPAVCAALRREGGACFMDYKKLLKDVSDDDFCVFEQSLRELKVMEKKARQCEYPNPTCSNMIVLQMASTCICQRTASTCCILKWS